MGSRALGGETRRALTLLFLWPFLLAASGETTAERKKERRKRGRWRWRMVVVVLAWR